jgi:NAD(P)-dependent dehydrogenase (short-subunit alcohol dehydrogenase family)
MKQAFFTGATGGLGEACVRALAARGWRVFAGGTNPGKLAALAAIPNVVPVAVDVTDEARLRAAHQTVCQWTDRLDAVVNFAGLTAFGSLIEGDAVAQCEKLLAINVMGTVRVNAAFLDLVEAGRGRIVNCSSSAAWMTAQPFAGAYVLSKRAIEGYTDSLRRELLFVGIPVVKLQPGSFRTGLTGDIDAGFARVLSQTVRYRGVLTRMKPLMDQTLRRSGDPARLARVVVRALEAKRPRARYRVGSDPLLCLMELLPEAGVDAVYRLLGRGAKG